MELTDYLKILKRKIWLFLVIFLIIFGVTSLYWFLGPKTQEALLTFTVKRIGESSSDQYGGYYAIQADDLVASNFITWAKSPSVVGDIYRRAEIDTGDQDPASLAKELVFKVNSAQNIELKIRSKDKERLEKFITAIKAVSEEKKQIDLAVGSQAGQIARIVEVGQDPIISIKKTDPIIILGASLFVALIISLVIIFLINYFAKTVDDQDQLRKIFGSNIDLVKIKSLKLSSNKSLERIRVLRNLLFSDYQLPFSLLLTSFEPKGTEKVAPALAEIIAPTQKTILVNTFIDSPKAIYKSKNTGLTEILKNNRLAGNIHRVQKNLFYIPAGENIREVKDLLTAPAIKKINQTLKRQASVIIFAAPPILTSPETYSILNQIEVLIVIVALSKTKQEDLKELKSLLRKKKIDLKILLVE